MRHNETLFGENPQEGGGEKKFTRALVYTYIFIVVLYVIKKSFRITNSWIVITDNGIFSGGLQFQRMSRNVK